MEQLIVSFAAGILTVLAPCILPLLPVVLGSSLVDNDQRTTRKEWLRPLTIILSLGLSIIAFTLLLKASSALLGIPSEVWAVLSGGIIVLLGLTFAFPETWERLIAKINLGSKSQTLLGKSSSYSGRTRDVATGFALGPVFNSCSPTYLFIVASVLPLTFGKGLGLLIAYTVGLCGTLLLIALAGQSLTAKLSFFADSKGVFKRAIGIILIVVGVLIVFGVDKDVQTYILDNGWYDPISRLEKSLK